MVELLAPLGHEEAFGQIDEQLLQLKERAEILRLKVQDESADEQEFRGPLPFRWAKEALLIITQHLQEQQKIALLSEQLTLLTYQPQEATNDDVNFKEELRQICDQLIFEVEQKELAVLAAPTRLQQHQNAVEAIFAKFRNELVSIEDGYKVPQIDRDLETSRVTALKVFQEGFERFQEQNQGEIDQIEDQKIAFREGKRELIDAMRSLINDFKKQVRASGKIVSLRQLFQKSYHLTPVWGLQDQSLIRGQQVWPQEKDFAAVPNSELKDLQVRQIRYYKVGSILSLCFILNNGLVSPYAGNSGVDRCLSVAEFPAGRKLRKIRVKASKNWVNEVRFLDENDSFICEVKADSGVGEWHDILLEPGERLIGFQEEHDQEQYVRRLGFVTFKLK